MNLARAASGDWSRSRWWLTLAGVLIVQVGFLFAFGERTPPRPRLGGPVSSLQLTVARTPLQEVEDPTLFARPHGRDFGAGWLRPAAPPFPVFRWTEPPRPLALPEDRLGSGLKAFLRSNVISSFTLGSRPPPELLVRQPEAVPEAGPTASRLAILGDLAARPLLNPPVLPPQPAQDLLTNSLVLVHVDAGGYVFTASLIGGERAGVGSGSAEADRKALEVARGLRFAPRSSGDWLTSPATGLTRGVLVFQWRTLPDTNGNAGARQP